MPVNQFRLCHIFHANIVNLCHIYSAKISVHTSKSKSVGSSLPKIFANETLSNALIHTDMFFFDERNLAKKICSSERAACELKLIDLMKMVNIEGHGHFWTVIS